MNMSKTKMLVLFGFLTWLLPFAASFLFYDPSRGGIAAGNEAFKSFMVVLSTLVGTLLLVKYFDAVKKDFVKEGLVVGAVWAVMNWIIDFVVLVPIMDVGAQAYFMSIGLRYLMIPIIAAGMGLAIENSARRHAAIGNSKNKKAQEAGSAGRKMAAKRVRK